MKTNVKYRQCTMRRSMDACSVATTSYIPQQYAKLGKVLKLKDSQDMWVDGWVVEKVGASIIDSGELPNYRKAIRNHRKLTGDSTCRSKN